MSEDVEELRKRKTLPKYSWEEVAKHNTSESLWLVVHDKVYDITEFMEEVSLGWLTSLVVMLLRFHAAPWWRGGASRSSR